MKNKYIIYSLCALLSPLLQASDTAKANITLHIPERLDLSAVPAVATSRSGVESIEAFFCVGSTSGLQFSIVSDDPMSASKIKLAAESELNQRSMARTIGVNECHKRNSGILQITQLPQGKRTVTAVVVTE